jgi:hypothetical protein
MSLSIFEITICLLDLVRRRKNLLAKYGDDFLDVSGNFRIDAVEKEVDYQIETLFVLEDYLIVGFDEN